jgi:hypothetical protein
MHPVVQHTEATQIIMLLAAIAIVACWRIVIKWLIMLASVAIIATLGYGVAMILQSTHHVAG